MKSHRVRSTELRNERSGVAIIMVIAFYAIAVTMMGVWVRSSLGHQRQVRRWHEKTQATWLAESGLGRAVASIGENSEYAGERWQLSAGELGGRDAAAVVIRVKPVPQLSPASGRPQESSSLVRITAIALYPADQQRVQATKTMEFRLPVTSDRAGESL